MGPYADEGTFSAFLHVPVLVGFNVDRLTFVLSPGGATLVNARGQLTQGVRCGAAIQLRLASWFAVHPEASWMREVAGPTDMGFATAGLGLIFFKLPKYQ
jgi:hypothetical protein